MGENPSRSTSSEDPSQQAAGSTIADPRTGAAQSTYSHGQDSVDSEPVLNAPYQQQYSGNQHGYVAQIDMAQQQHLHHQHQQQQQQQQQQHQHQTYSRVGPYNMGAMANALPQQGAYRSGQGPPGQPQRFSPASSNPNMAGPMQLPQYVAQGSTVPISNQQQYYMSQQGNMTQYFPMPMSPSQAQPSVSPRTNMGYYQPPVVMAQHHGQPPATFYYTQTGQYPQQPGMPAQMMSSAHFMPSNTPHTDPHLLQAQLGEQVGSPQFPPDQRSSPIDGRSNVVRGPPRKPRQSGHAIWIGNLPPQTDLMNLVHHVCKEASGLESLFLISKSNCAFANFRDEASCFEAQQKLNESRFQSVRLVSRLRKSTVEGTAGVTAPTGPAASSPHPETQHEPQRHDSPEEDDATPTAAPVKDLKASAGADNATQRDRFFILKSLTVEDLELSVRTGIWATQAHNEEILNTAFKSAENVYLVFSANKSGEYFGYARMTSPINDDPTAAIEFAPKVQSAVDVDLPKAIATEATEFAPRGRIIDDSARGTIFWEAERGDSSSDSGAPDEDSGSQHGSTTGDSSSVKSGQADGESKAWGKPFKLEWMSTSRLPFYRTRGLRNLWNSNREVKIARDGTELEPNVGRRLIGLFSRIQSPSSAGPRGMLIMPGYPPVGRAPYGQ